jgi:HSP20 family protein
VPVDEGGDAVGVWRPVAEVIDTPDSLEIECELAGLKREQVDLRLDGQYLVLQGERVQPEGTVDWNYHRLERAYGKFLRRFELPGGLDVDLVRASLDGGVLRITLPKRPEARSRTIPVDLDEGGDN